MAKRGRRPDRARWQEAAKLRAQGLSLSEVGAKMGVTKQAADYLLRQGGRDAASRCRSCRAPLTDKPLHRRGTAPTYFLACLAKHPEATLGERLRAYRGAAELTAAELAERVGLNAHTVIDYEHGTREPGWRTLGKLVKALGAGLIVAEDGRPQGPAPP